MGTKLTKEEKGVLADHFAEVYRVTSNGTRNLSDVCRVLQDIVEGKFPSANPFVQQVERQLACWQEAGVAISPETRKRILAQAEQFVPATLTDGPLVSGGFGYALSSVNDLWDAITPPTGYQKVRYMGAEIPLRYASDMMPLQGGLHLIHFDPNSYQGLSPKDALVRAKTDGVRLAGVEVLEKLLVDPDYCNRWNGNDQPFPYLSGLQAKYNSGWSSVPCLDRWGGSRQLDLHAGWAVSADSFWSSPVVREC